MREYNTEIISVGTEILLGHIVNTDARDISEMLSKIGINVKYHTVVGDNPERLRQCIETAKKRADIIITTGGLGPTCDDLTKFTLAEAFGVKLVMNEAEKKGLYDYIHPEMPFSENNLQQALLPENCTVFHNTCGTAPGCAFEAQGKIVIMVPGPPKECNAMFALSAVPYLKSLSNEEIVSHSVRIFGIGESSVDQIFRDEMNVMENPTMAPYAKECDCFLQVTAKAGSREEAERMTGPVIEHIKERLCEYVYGIEGEVAKRFTDIPGASSYFKGGVVTYTNEAKEKLLGIDAELLENFGAVSYPVAAEMAEKVRELLKTDLAVGITGLAGPDGDGVNEVGTVFVSLATENETFVRELHLGTGRSRSYIRRMSGNHAYDMMRRYLTGLKVI